MNVWTGPPIPGRAKGVGNYFDFKAISMDIHRGAPQLARYVQTAMEGKKDEKFLMCFRQNIRMAVPCRPGEDIPGSKGVLDIGLDKYR